MDFMGYAHALKILQRLFGAGAGLILQSTLGYLEHCAMSIRDLCCARWIVEENKFWAHSLGSDSLFCFLHV